MPFRACPFFLQITHSHGHMGRSGPPSSTWFLLAHQSHKPQHKQHLHRFSRFCAPQSVHIIYNELPFSHHNCHFPFLWGIWTHLHVIHGFIRGVSALEVLRLCAIQIYILLTYLLTLLSPSEFPARTTSRLVQQFCTVHRRVSLYLTAGRPFPPQNCPFPCGHLHPYLSLGPPDA